MGLSTLMTEAEAATLFGVGSDELLTREEAASLLRVTPRTLINWANEGHGPRAARVGARTFLYSKRELLAHVEACRPPPSHAPAAISPASQAAVIAERRRVRAIWARCPGEGYRATAAKAIREGLSIEAYDASLPRELRVFMPPLSTFLHEFDRTHGQYLDMPK